MKRFLLSVVFATSLVFTSCQFDDSAIWGKINDHEKRIVALEELCKQMNTNISSLQSIVNALQKNDYITNVSPVRKDGEEIGYTITFAYGDTITIYHGTNGKDGANGKDGKDGYTPQIGVMKDTDGIYYWTVDGEWLLDSKGNKVQANGVNGANGKDGIDGADGITPRLKIENDYWYVSYDNGATWTELGKATGEDETAGDTIFSSVTQDDEYVYFNLADGTMITLPKHDKENIQFEDLLVKAICCKSWDTNKDGELSYAEAAAVTDIGARFAASAINTFTELRYFTGITKIPSQAFMYCTSLWKITLPNGITEIGDIAFNGYNGSVNLYYMNIPHTVNKIGTGCFRSSSVKYLCIDDINAWCEIEFEDSAANPIRNAEVYLNGAKLSELSILSDVTQIKKYAFYSYDSLTNVTIGNSVTSIGESAFYGCNSLTNVTIGNSVTSIGESAFRDCESLKEVYCKPTTPPAGGNLMFHYIASGYKIYVPTTSVNAYKSAMYWKDYSSAIVGYDFEK